MLILIWILNFAISWFNAWGVGKSWVEAKAVGGMPRFMSWMGATMAAVGFTWCYLVILAYVAQASGKFSNAQVAGMFSLGYLVIIVPLIGSGFAITAGSWAHFWRQRSFGNGAIAGWNTFAQISNTFRAISAVPSALRLVGEGFKVKGGGKSKGALVLVLMVVLAVAGGVMTTMAIVKAAARAHIRDLFPEPVTTARAGRRYA
jgi:hypothetical protein